MKWISFELAGVLIAFVVGYPCSSANASGEEDAIRRSADEFVEAYDHGDAARLAALWTEDGEYKIGTSSVKGRAAITALYKEYFKDHPGSKMKVKIDSIRILAPTVALEEGTSSVLEGGSGVATASAYAATHVKKDGKWKMVIVRDSETPTIQFDRDVKELAWLVGEWRSVAAKDSPTVSLKCNWMANQNFLRADVTVRGGKGEVPGGVQIIGRNPQSGEIVSWFFSANGGFGTGTWYRDGKRWYVQTSGLAADGTPTAATNIIYRPNDDVVSWQSTRRLLGDTPLPDVKEVVIERVKGGK